MKCSIYNDNIAIFAPIVLYIEYEPILLCYSDLPIHVFYSACK